MLFPYGSSKPQSRSRPILALQMPFDLLNEFFFRQGRLLPFREGHGLMTGWLRRRRTRLQHDYGEPHTDGYHNLSHTLPPCFMAALLRGHKETIPVAEESVQLIVYGITIN